MTHLIENCNRVIQWYTCTRLPWKGITCHTLIKEAKKGHTDWVPALWNVFRCPY